MQVSKYLYKHFAQLNCHNLNYGVKITSAVLLQYVKALGFRVLTLKFYGKPKRNNFSITVKHPNYNNCYCLNWRTNKNVPTLIINRLVKGLYIPLASLKISTI